VESTDGDPQISFILWLLPALHAVAQQPAPLPSPGWQRVMALPSGTRIAVKTKSHSLNCNLKAVDAEALTCGPHAALGDPKDVVLQQADIKLIKIKRRARSVLIDTGIGAASGAILGLALTANQPSVFFNSNDWRGTITAGAAIGLGGIGAIVGAVTDSASSTIYKAP